MPPLSLQFSAGVCAGPFGPQVGCGANAKEDGGTTGYQKTPLTKKQLIDRVTHLTREFVGHPFANKFKEGLLNLETQKELE